MRLRSILSALILAVPLAGCVQHRTVVRNATAPTLNGDAQHPASTQGWVDTHLYFGLGPADRPEEGISEALWRAFLDREVTPRFPSGLSVVDVYGQWQGKVGATVERLRSKMLIILYQTTPKTAPGSKPSAPPGSETPAIRVSCVSQSRQTYLSEPGAHPIRLPGSPRKIHMLSVTAKQDYPVSTSRPLSGTRERRVYGTKQRPRNHGQSSQTGTYISRYEAFSRPPSSSRRCAERDALPDRL